MNEVPAILGGTPLFSSPLHLVRPPLPDREKFDRSIDDLYASRMLSNQGKYAREFETRIAAALGVKHCAVFCNATIALMALARALDLKGEVILPSFTFAATAHSLMWQGIDPQFVDIELETFNLDPKEVERFITPATSAILGVHLFGNPCNHDRLSEIADQHGIPLLYDAAHAFGSSYRGRKVGSLGRAEVLSFHATKLIHSGEGGAVVTQDSSLYERLCRIRNHGFEGYLNCVDLGINGKMDEFSAVVGCLLLDDFDKIVSGRRDIFETYTKALSRFPGLACTTPVGDPSTHANYSYFYMVVDAERFGLSSLELNYALTAEGIVSRCYFYPPIHRTKYYQERFPGRYDLPHSDWAALHLICLPVSHEQTGADTARVIQGVERCLLHAQEIKTALVGRVPSSWESLRTTPPSDPHERLILHR